MHEQKPTKEQIKEFWEWCGLRLYTYACERLKGYTKWEYGLETIGRSLPDIDLNNLFKYAVPKLVEKFKEDATEVFRTDDLYAHIREGYARSRLTELLCDWVRDFVHYERDPALALFWAIWKVIHAR